MRTLWLIILFSLPIAIKAQIITTIAGGGSVEGDGGPATAAHIPDPSGCTFDKYGNYYVASCLGGNRVRKIDTNGIITCVAGTGAAGYNGDNIPATTAELNLPADVAVDTFGNLYIADGGNNRIRKIDANTGIISTIAGNGTAGYSGDYGLATAAMLWDPIALCLDKYDNIYISDDFNNRIRKIDTAGIITTFAGNGVGSHYGGDGGLADTSAIPLTGNVRSDAIGNIYAVCSLYVLKINTAGILSTFAGTSTGYLYNGDGIPATSAQIDPVYISFDLTGNLYISELYNYRVRMIDNAGIIHTVAGNGIAGSSGDGGPADSAEFDYPGGLAFDPCDNLYVTDIDDGHIRKVAFNPLSVTPIPTVNISAAISDTVCLGASATLNAVVAGGGSVSTTYKWYVNGVSVSTGGSSYSYIPANGDSVWCVVTSFNPCSSPGVASNTIHMVVDTATTPAIHVTASTGDTICTGTSVTYSAVATSAGSTPGYQWVVNGSYVGTGGSTYTYTPANGDSIRCILTGSAPCATTVTASSNTLIMVVGASELPGIFITVAPRDSVCTGTAATFTASISLGGASPVYQWKVDGSNVGISLNTYTYTPADGDSIRCVLTSDASCAVPATVSSNTIDMVVNSFIVPAIAIASSATAAIGSTVTVNATVANAGSSYSINWYNNGVLFSTTTTPVVTFTQTSSTDNITATVVSTSVGCYDSTTSSILTIEATSGISNLNVAKMISIYPNPAHDVVQIEAANNIAGVTISDVVGVEWRSFVSVRMTSIQIDISDLRAGVYVVAITDEEGNKTVHKIVKQ